MEKTMMVKLNCILWHLQVVKGQGIDRHMFGLKMIAKENGIALPELFTDETFHVAGHWKLSTSQVCRSNQFV